jgi:predicted O-linked N-acetylglucosamine transferase (SPINDLY family)
VNKLPAADRGVVTFCSPNNFCKVTPATLDAWRRLLAQVPLSRLLLHTCNGDHRQRVREFLGLDEARLIFVDRLPLDQYFKLYQQTDIALDPFPCVGGTTTCDALWMGVPVITLTGQTAVSRAGASILTNVGRTEWIAHSVDQYIDLATALASDLTRLQEIRATLRPQMMNSPLMDATTFARGVDDAYRTMWANWCHTRQSQIGQ